MRSPQALKNRLVRLLRGLPPPGLAVSPVIPNDLFAAHRAGYLFATRFASPSPPSLGRVLDLGCGTGYGAAELAATGAREVLGVDVDPLALAFARRRYASGTVRFVEADAARLPPDLGSFELVVAVNLLAQMREPEAALGQGAAHLAEDGGIFLASVPPILDAATMDRHREAAPHASNLYLWEWEDLLRSSFSSLRLFGQIPPPGKVPDLADPGPARIRAEDYSFPEISLARPEGVGHLAAFFLAENP